MCLALLPGWGELLENVEHLVRDGHPAHAVAADAHDEDAGHAGHDALEAEHGCTPMTHLCGCHASVPVVFPEAVQVPWPRRVVVQERRPWAFEASMVQRALAPPVPPPLAEPDVEV